ncbi:vitamin B12 dependent-methionine synthase activation domain-containing protein [Romboutsia sp.]|uniref:vitamin B12 dependent-methionine synthase activation domain-containing protein n=1 Tax=Romboutsia sp. TaxID=1965302 RepID=UPI003F331855
MDKICINRVDINRDEVLRYLEYKGQEISGNLEKVIDECIKTTIEKINPRYILRVYPILKKCEANEYKIILQGTNLVIKSKDIYNLLYECNECIVMAATLGIDIEKEIRKNSYCELTKSIIIDACATTAIEAICDLIQHKAKEVLNNKNNYMTNRYSPGYGDLPLHINSNIINILNASKEIGLTITGKDIMIPRKSVTAIIGISKNKLKNNSVKCLGCSKYETCKYKKGDENCGYKRVHKK